MQVISRKRGAYWIALTLALCASTSCKDQVSQQTKTSTKDPVSVTVISPQSRDFVRTVRVTGTLRGDEETTIAAKVSGRVLAVFKDFGDAANKGEKLLRIDPKDYELARDERSRALMQSLAKLGLSELPPANFDVRSLPAVERAQLQAENAKARYDRGALLANRTPPSISQQDFADLRTAWEVAESNVRVERLTAEAGLAEARTLESQLRIAEQRLEDTWHRAPSPDSSQELTQPVDPFVYHVAQRFVSLGDFVQIGAPLFRLVDQDPVKLRATAPERKLGAIAVGQSARIWVEAFQKPFDAKVSRVSPTVDIATRTFGIEILAANDKGNLKPGSFATADIVIGTEKALALPKTAIITFAGVHKVVLSREGKAVEQRVTLGESAGDWIEILSGLKPEDMIVEKPISSMSTGTPLLVQGRGESK